MSTGFLLFVFSSSGRKQMTVSGGCQSQKMGLLPCLPLSGGDTLTMVISWGQFLKFLKIRDASRGSETLLFGHLECWT